MQKSCKKRSRDAPQILKALKKQRFVNEFCHDIRQIVRAFNFDELKVAPTDFFLYPKVRCGQMADTSKAATTADANRRCCICADLQIELIVEVASQADKAQADGGPLANPHQLGFAARGSDCSLRE